MYASVFVTELIGLNVKILITALVLLAAKFLTDYFLTSKQNDIAYKNSMNMQPFKRKEAYFRRLFFIKKNAYDMKTPSLSKLFKDEYLKSTEETLQRQIENNKSEVRISMIKTLYNKAFSNIIVVLILICALKCSGLNDVSVYWKISAFFTSMFGLGILQIPAEIKNYSNYIGKIRSFLQVKTEPFRTDCTKAPHIVLKNVSFSYDENSEFSLKNINMDIEAEKTIAIVGKNGSGKTTLLNILLGLYNPTSGEITADGINLSKFDLIDNQFISLLSQNFNIYFASIRDNVTMGKVGFSDDDVLEALTLAKCDEFFNKFKDGLDTKIGRQFDENAVELSGGQSQRIALARVFLSESPLVFLDEPTSAIDPIFETAILENLEKKLKGKTAVMITHRLIMTKLADKIYVMDNGRIIEEGSFAELMELKGMFYDMYKFQESR